MNNITFREITQADIDMVVTMMQDFYAIDGYPIDVAVSKGLMHEFIENPSLGVGFMIYNDNASVGYVILTFVFSFEYKGRIAFLDELYIDSSQRGKGIGKLALDFVTEQAKSHAVKIIYLEIEGHNTVAQKLYLSKGYSIHNRGLMRLVVE
ncbi:MAG: GNAT family N-acetyltransferase [Flavobacterium sp.]